MRTFYSIALVLLALPAYAQHNEFGMHGGVSFYNSKSVSADRGTADAGMKLGYGGGVTLGQNMYDKLGGEVRYMFLRNDLKVSSAGTDVTFGAQTHAFNYDLLLHAAGRESKVRPYVAFGGGLKLYRGTGDEVVYRPLQNFAIPTKTTELQGMISVGGGVKVAISHNVIFRLDVHDFITRFPKEVLAPAPGVSLGGWINNIVPTAGITFTF